MWAKSSLSNSRAIRWFGVTAQILLSLFVDALLFGILYPDQGVCEAYTTESDCTTPFNSYTLAQLCAWRSSSVTVSDDVYSTTTTTASSCSPEGPPSTIYFTMIIALITVVMTIPVSMGVDYIISEFCNTRPDLDKWGLDRYLSFLYLLSFQSYLSYCFFFISKNIPAGCGWARATEACLKTG
jgi:hypothetical protein